jgi:two-component sensor histidine kinase
MNTVMNLLSLQADTTTEEATVSSLRNAVARMKSMSILYDKLYRSDNLTAMSIRQYLPFLAKEIMSIFPDSLKVELEMDVEDFILDVPLLSTLGMIVNELLFNAMKHAFNGRDSGLISIIASAQGNRGTLVFEDNGIGIPDTVSLDNPQSFGLKLVIGLASQIGATLKIDRSKGTRFVFSFNIA